MRPTKIAVAGATGNVGARIVAALERAGHEVVRISRSLGVDLITGDGLDAALTGVDAVVDATSYEAADPDDAVAYFGTTTRNLLAAEERAGVRHTCCSRSSASIALKATRTTPASVSRSAS
jgi:uncharacterized protein YbjT (DUF2867 family)